MTSNPPPGHPESGANAMTERFREVAERILDALLEITPEWASELGDHRFADRLSDHSAAADAQRAATLADALSALDEIDDTMLPPGDFVDLEMLRSRVSADMWRCTELRPHSWDPLRNLPGDAVTTLVARDNGLPSAERLEALAARCRAIPDYLRTAQCRLEEGPGMPRVHVETAASQVEGLVAMLGEEVTTLLDAHPSLRRLVDPARFSAMDALREHAGWLRDRIESATADPRLGERHFAAQLWYTLDSELSPDTLLTRAESDLLGTEEEIAEVAAEYDGRPRHSGQVREVLDRIADEGASSPDSVRSLCEDALMHLRQRVTDLDLFSVPENTVRVIPMPEARRGVSMAYCDPPGPLGPGADEPTLVAVAPPPGDWPAERRASFYREYNASMVRTLMAHEGVPGHALQLSRAAGYTGATRVRHALRSGTFVEGWAVYAEEVMARRGWTGEGSGEDLALRLVQLKMRLRVIINAILDVRTHTRTITQSDARTLLTERGHQEEGEAAGKWRRAQLTSGQMSTYYAGQWEIGDLVRDLERSRPMAEAREVHDELLAHGSPPPRHLRTLLGL